MKIAPRGCAGLLILALAGVLPSGAAATLQEPAAAEAPPSDELAQLDGILDLLIDGRFAEARDKAARLLEQKDLPEAVQAWALKLREKAEERLADSTGSGPALPAESNAAVSPASQEQPAPAEQLFPARQAVIGGGFAAGVRGSLRISAAGLAFTRDGRAKAEWAIEWKEFSAAGRDGGIWDVPEPLVIADRRGTKHYLVRVDKNGRYLSAGPILAAIEQERKQWRSAAGKVQKQP